MSSGSDMEEFLPGKVRDVIVMGRANVDMYVANPKDSLGESALFEKSVGGSAANIAVGLSRLGRRVDFLGKLSADPFGQFVENFLSENGIGTAFVSKDESGTLTSLAFAERKPVDSQVLFYRNGASDLFIDVDDVPVEELGRTPVLVTTGTGLSASPSREATLYAMETALSAGCTTVLDLDWRASAWGSVKTAGLIYRRAAALSSIIIGTEDEFSVLLDSVPGAEELSEKELATHFLKGHTALVVVKRGAQGSSAYTADSESHAGIFPVEVQKNYGAGDAFAAGFIHGLLSGKTPEEAMRQGSAAAAIVVSGDGCASSAPTAAELSTFMES